MNIGFVHPTWPGGEGTGAAHSATQVVTGLRDRGHRVTAYCQESPPSEAVTPGISIVDFDLDRFPYHSSSVLNRELTHRLDGLGNHDVVHGYPPSTVPAITRVATETPAATVVTLNAYAGVCPKNDLLYRGQEHCSDNTPRRCVDCIARTSRGHGVSHWLKRTAGRLGNLRMVRKGLAGVDAIDGFRAPSGHVRENYVEFGFSKDKIRVIPHPLDESFLMEHKSDFEEPIKLLYVGYLEPQKGVEKLLPILDGVCDQGIDASLTVVGDGQERAEMVEQARTSGRTDRVDFRGHVSNEELPEVYVAHDVLLHPGIWQEPLARVYIEALATGTPIVTTEYGAVETVVGDGGVTTDGTVSGFVDIIAELIRDERLLSLSQGSMETIDRYRLERVIPQIEALYDSIS